MLGTWNGGSKPQGRGDRGFRVPHPRVGGCRHGGSAHSRWGGLRALYPEQVYQRDVGNIWNGIYNRI